MKTFIKWTLAIAILAVVVAGTARNVMIKHVSRAAVLKATGFDLEIGAVNLGFISPDFEIRGVRLINPEDFPEALAFDIRRAYVRYDFKSLMTDKVCLREVTLDVPEIVMVVKDDGDSNLERLRSKSSMGGSDDEKKPAPALDPTRESAGASSGRQIQIDRLQLKVGRVVIHRYLPGQTRPEESVLELNLDKTYANVASLGDVGVLISADIMTQELLGRVGDTLGQYEDRMKAAGAELGNKLKGLFKPGNAAE